MTSNIRIVYTADPRFLNSIHVAAKARRDQQQDDSFRGI